MKLHSFKLSSFLGKTALATAALGFFLAAGAPAAKANDWDDCNRRISYTESRYREAVERFGPYSRDARHWEHERHEAYERREHLRHEYREHHRDRDDRYQRNSIPQTQKGRPNHGRPFFFLMTRDYSA